MVWLVVGWSMVVEGLVYGMVGCWKVVEGQSLMVWLVVGWSMTIKGQSLNVGMVGWSLRVDCWLSVLLVSCWLMVGCCWYGWLLVWVVVGWSMVVGRGSVNDRMVGC